MMTVFVAGASGAVGNQLVPQLISAGYEVVAMTHSPQHDESLRAQGATPVVADALDRSAVIAAVKQAAPDVIIDELTALAGVKDFKRFDDEFALTNRLRTEGTTYLLEAAHAAGVRRFIAQSYGNWNYARTGSGPKTEDDPLDPTPPKNQTQTLAAIRALESAVLCTVGIEGVALRYGNLYGPGTNIGKGGGIIAMVRKRGLPLVGSGAGVWSFIHIADAASAAVTAIEHGEPGVYNIADDEPAPVRVWLPELARAVGARPPRHIPAWLARPLIGEVGVSMMTQIRGASNAKARRDLGWQPQYVSWREGFRAGLG